MQEPLVSSEDSQVSGGQIPGQKCGSTSEHIWGDVELSVSAALTQSGLTFMKWLSLDTLTKCGSLLRLAGSPGQGGLQRPVLSLSRWGGSHAAWLRARQGRGGIPEALAEDLGFGLGPPLISLFTCPLDLGKVSSFPEATSQPTSGALCGGGGWRPCHLDSQIAHIAFQPFSHPFCDTGLVTSPSVTQR